MCVCAYVCRNEERDTMQTTKMLKITEDIKISFHSESRCDSLELVRADGWDGCAVQDLDGCGRLRLESVGVEASCSLENSGTRAWWQDQGVGVDVEG